MNPDTQMQYTVVITAALPFGFSWLASTLAGILAQDRWSDDLNALVAYLVVFLCALLNAYVDGKLAGGLALIVGVGSAGTTVLLATTMQPLKRWTDILQANFCVVRNGRFYIFVPNLPMAASNRAVQPDMVSYTTAPMNQVQPRITLPTKNEERPNQ